MNYNIYFNNGKEVMAYNLRQAIDVAYLISAVEGSTETLIIDSGINKHYYGWKEDPGHPGRLDQDIHTIHASKDNPITAYQIMELFEDINAQFSALPGGRSYFYQGLEFNPNINMYVKIHWGS